MYNVQYINDLLFIMYHIWKLILIYSKYIDVHLIRQHKTYLSTDIIKYAYLYTVHIYLLSFIQC